MDVAQFARPVAVSLLVGLGGSVLLSGSASAEVEVPEEGVLRLLTYNVAGLPEGISRSSPSRNIPRMVPLLADYDLVLVQEDFAFPAALRQGLALPYATAGSWSGVLSELGDGLSRFARHPFLGHRRVPWRACHGVFDAGSDCLAPKGYSVATHEISPGVPVDVYNVHLDAGRSAGDRRARERQVDQLLEALGASPERAVVVAGDTNTAAREPAFRRLLDEAGLHDACAEVSCPDGGRIDRVLFRSSAAVRLSAGRWRIDRRFVDEAGRPLSDHLAVAVDLRWHRQAPELTASRAPL